MDEPAAQTPQLSTTAPELRHRFRRLPPETIEAILDFHRTLAPALVPVIMTGILGYYLPEETVAMLKDELGGTGMPPAAEPPALDADSLTMLEIVLDLEDALGIEFDKEEITSIRTAPEMRLLLMRKIEEKRALRA